GRDGWDTLVRITNELRARQRDDGGWGQYPGSDIDLSATVKGYFALKLMGDDPAAPHMIAARKRIRELGGAERVNSFTSFYLACLGQVSWNAVPAIPPEIVYLPRWFYFHMTKVSAWTRTMILPLSIVTTLRPTRALTPSQSIDELFISDKERHRLTQTNPEPVPAFWRRFFFSVDWTLKQLHRIGGTPVRRLALKRAAAWILERAGQDGEASTDGIGAIFPPMVYLQIAFMAMGTKRSDPVIRRAERELDEFFIEDPERDRIRIQPCFSPVWDTGIALYALTDCGLDHAHPGAARAADWLVKKECRHRGDWADNVETPVTPSGWYFEYHNSWYPDVDDTAMVAMALKRCGATSHAEAGGRGVDWILAMQNDDGGWAAFDRTKHRQILEYIPFADHNAMQDPSCHDITGRILECLSWHGYGVGHPAVDRAIEYITAKQEPEGCFFGRWGVNYIYGTWQAVIGPIRCGVSRDEPWIRRAGEWIKSVQKDDGSFGETANSYVDRSLMGTGPSTASQTAWAAMILQEVFGKDDPDLHRAIDWLARTQLTEAAANDPEHNPDGDPPGSWRETEYTGTGFPRVFYLRYHYYRLYFPLMALGRYLGAHGLSLADEPATVKMRPKVEGR
ncbi:MAG: squalene--hopene cyclase, partial [Pseudomonadales bacterium]|nr:squalene--hopene cyclase [Pseudomonadales bacterium]